ncbi:hypothetical protein CHUAL_003463 [Chamberlinius hualienensis]
MASLIRVNNMRSLGRVFVRQILPRIAYSTLTHENLYPKSLVLSKQLRDSAYRVHANSVSGIRWYGQENKNTDLNFEDFQALLKSGDIQLIDVREPKEIEEHGGFPNAINIPLGELIGAISKSDEEFAERYSSPKPQPHHRNIVFCGKGPIRTKAAMELIKQLSYKM